MPDAATFTGDMLINWAKALDRRTLLLLDNVEEHWVQGKLWDQFQTKFVLKVLQHSSTHLDILITSLHNIEFTQFLSFI